MNTKKLTEASLLSALFVVMSIIAISTGIAYSIYLDVITPIIISLIYLRVGFKYLLLCSITSLLIIILAIGDIVSGIWLTQGILLGFSCGYFIPKGSTIFDDILCTSMLGTLIMVLVDIYFSALTGYSFIKDFERYSTILSLNKELFDITLYIFIATLSVGTTLVIYFSTLFIGKKLNIVNRKCERKLFIIRNFRKYSSYMCCSERSLYRSLIYVVMVEILKNFNININFIYLRTVIFSVEIIALYFIIRDSYAIITKYIYLKTKSSITLKGVSLFIILQLLYSFKVTTFLIILVSISINISIGLREKQISFLNEGSIIRLTK